MEVVGVGAVTVAGLADLDWPQLRVVAHALGLKAKGTRVVLQALVAAALEQALAEDEEPAPPPPAADAPPPPQPQPPAPQPHS